MLDYGIPKEHSVVRIENGAGAMGSVATNQIGHRIDRNDGNIWLGAWHWQLWRKYVSLYK